ncbi:imidazolonepropionase [Fodinicurvata sp. EGI_FJ10296]|uniref:imidazolonepropionase n=1 Tax=Fodinicurvata sp. EGI_FJ10296 TaxID=3231908 RepID=UPI0034512B04
MWEQLWLDLNVATMASEGPPLGVDEGSADGIPEAGPLGIIRDAAIAVDNGRIAWVGRRSDLPGAPETLARQTRRMSGMWVTPGLIDCHTHLVFGGDRAREFALRLAGASYEEIARAGGGIASTVAATRAADEDTLFQGAMKRVGSLAAEGVTTVEIKSGYGLDLATERRMLAVASRIGAPTLVDVRRTFLGAHAVPPEYRDRADAYIDLVVEEMLPAIASERLADAVDAFGESIAFSPSQVERVFEQATACGLPVKLHADQLSDQGGAALAARFNALSADHLEYTTEAGAEAMAAAGTVAVLLPGAFYTLRESQCPPIAAFRRHGVPMAVATDCNPGSSPIESLLTTMNMACTLFRMTTEEVLTGVTRHAAAALGLHDRGVVAPGMRADLAFWSVADPAELCYRIGGRVSAGRLLAGRALWSRDG